MTRRQQLYGPDNPNWKGGKPPERSRGRARTWRQKVLERDGHACQTCGSRSDLHAHHLQEYEGTPNLRWEVSNGTTLCGECHRLTHRLDRASARISPCD
jgi:5-methylcytosine-specific restriction endonuclease McrA